MKTLIVKKPWGQFEQFTHNEATSVKVHSFNPNSAWSLQYHNHRDEFYKILSGHPIVTIGENKINANPGDEFAVAKQEKHRVETKDEPAQLLEICYGDFDENDIIRIEDKYGRA